MLNQEGQTAEYLQVDHQGDLLDHQGDLLDHQGDLLDHQEAQFEDLGIGPGLKEQM